LSDEETSSELLLVLLVEEVLLSEDEEDKLRDERDMMMEGFGEGQAYCGAM